MRKNILNVCLFFILFILNGCVDDKTVHDLKELNEVTINGVSQSRYEAYLGKEFVLNPQITASKNEENLEYLWYCYQNFKPFKSDTISREKVLKHTFSDMIIGGNYSLTLKVRDKESNVFYQKTVPFVPINEYSIGTLLLCKDGGESEINMLRMDTDEFRENIFAKQNSGLKLDAESNRVIYFSRYDRNVDAFKGVMVYSNTANGGHYINNVNFTQEATMRGKIDDMNLGANVDCQHYCFTQTRDYIVCNGQLHYRRGTVSSPVVDWSSAVKVYGDKPDYYLAPVSLHPKWAYPLVFDNHHHRFMMMNSANRFTFFTGVNHQMDAFDANDLGDGMEMLCTGYFSNNNLMWALMKNTVDGKFWILRFSYLDDIFTAEAKIEVTPEMAPGLAEASKFESMSDLFATNQNPWVIRIDGTQGRLLYLANNKVYVLNMNSGAGGKAGNLVIDGDAINVEITNVLSHPIILSSEISETVPQYTRIDLCVKDNSVSGKNGGVIFYQVDELGGMSVEEIYRKTGFCDEVVDVDEKVL